MEREQILKTLSHVGALITGSHVVYTSERHGTDYVDKDRVGTDPIVLSMVAAAVASEVKSLGVEMVVSPALGAITLGENVAYHLSALTGISVKFVIAEKEAIAIPDPEGLGRKCFYHSGNFSLRPNDPSFIKDKCVLEMEDILTTGASAKRVVELIRRYNPAKTHVAALVNRGKVSLADVGTPDSFFSLISLDLPSYTEAECANRGPCAARIPINTLVGKGKDFLARKSARA